MSDTATVQLSVIDPKTGQVTLNETFHLAAHLTTTLIEQLEAVVAGLPPKRVRVSRSQESGATVIDLEVLSAAGKRHSKTTPQPTFADIYRRKVEEVPDEQP